MVAQCAVCHSVFHFESEFTDGRIGVAVQKAETTRPENVQVENWSGGLTLYWRWLNWRILLFTTFALAWNAITISFFGIMMAGILEGDFDRSYFFFCFPIGISLFLVYYVLAGFVNQTKVIVDGQTIRIQHSPLPWGSEKMVERGVVQLYTRKRYSGNYWFGHYHLYAISSKGEHVILLSGLETPEHAIFVEQEIEKFLGIEDLMVKGEYGRA
jgi:hypothetical protein